MSPSSNPTWTFLTNHAHVLLCVARDGGTRMRDIAETVGITERAAQRIAADLVREGYVTSERVGRRNQYSVNGKVPLRHPMDCHHEVGALLTVLSSAPDDAVGNERPARGRDEGNRTQPGA